MDLREALLLAAAAFIKGYILKGGWHDGTPGLIWSGFELFYKFVLIAKVIEARVRETQGRPNSPAAERKPG